MPFSLKNSPATDVELTELYNPDEGQRTYSSVHSDPSLKSGSINSATCWAGSVNGWTILDLGGDKTINGVAMQGRKGASDQWVTQYTVKYWLDGQTEAYRVEVDSGATFDVPSRINDNSHYHKIMFQQGTITARYVRIKVEAVHGYAAMRTGVIYDWAADKGQVNGVVNPIGLDQARAVCMVKSEFMTGEIDVDFVRPGFYRLILLKC